MELSILDSSGLPEGSILSVRSGPTRRQSPLPCTAPFRLPAGPWPLRIDVLALLGKSPAGASLGKLDPEGCCKVPLEARDGRQMSVTLQVFEGKAAGMRPKTAPNLKGGKDLEEPEAEASPSSPVRRRDTEAEARAYLDRHRLHEFMHALFELLLRERPTDPYSFIAARFREAATREPSGGNDALALPPLSMTSKLPCASPGNHTPDNHPARHSISSATPSARKENSSPVPEGAIQVIIRTMRGRSTARLTIKPTDKIGDLKARLQSNLGVPANSQTLLWWAETLSNDTTLEDHDIPSGASIHLVCSTRDPRFTHALSGSGDGGLKLWSMENGELLRDFSGGHVGSSAQKVQAVAVDWTRMRAVTGSHSGCLHHWDLESGTCLGPMEGHDEEVNVIDVDWSRMRALSGSSDGTAKLWNLEERKCVLTLQGGSPVYTLAVDWTKMRGFGGLRSGLVRLWDLTSGNHIRDFSVGASAADAAGTAVSATAIDFSGNRAVSGLEDGHLAYWHFSATEDAGDKAAVPPLPTPTTKMLLAHYSAVRTIVAKWVESGSRALCGSDDGSLSLWRLDSQECVARFARHISFVWAIYADWARDRAVSGAFDGCIKLWDLRTGDCLRTLQGHSRPVRSIAAG